MNEYLWYVAFDVAKVTDDCRHKFGKPTKKNKKYCNRNNYIRVNFKEELAYTNIIKTLE